MEGNENSLERKCPSHHVLPNRFQAFHARFLPQSDRSFLLQSMIKVVEIRSDLVDIAGFLSIQKFVS